jgi:hypothetical protein
LKIKKEKSCSYCGSKSIRHNYKGGHSGKKKATWSGAYQVCTTCDRMQGTEKRINKKRNEDD